jgi:mono/diheme cytochrome c family protein
MLAAIAVAAVAVTSLAAAQELTDRQKGRLLARQVCAECHAVDARSPRSPNPRSPKFVDIAATPGMTGIALNAFLHTSHNHMPNLILNDEQTRAIIAYILGLKA